MSAWTLDSIAESLQARSQWAASDGPIEKRQTHISVVLLGQRNVLKLKKPVDFGFLDYTTLQKRRAACEAEVSLNRRLCPEAYLGVRAVVAAEGAIELSDEDAPGAVDYGVWMTRLPAGRMLDHLVRSGAVTESIVDRVALRLTDFFRQARRSPQIDSYGDAAAITRNWEENFAQIAPYVGRTIRRQDLEPLRAWVWTWMRENDPLLRSRAAQHRIVEGHGDVRCESICVTDGICIFDCIEFNERFRCNDPASEAAFLAVDLDALGRPDLGYHFTERFATRSGDAELWRLLPFFRCYRAFVRGKVHSFLLDDSALSKEERDKAECTARRWMDLAVRYASPLPERTLVVVCGFSGTGKTSLARAVAGELGLRVISSDDVRAQLFGSHKQPAAFGEGAYSTQATHAVYTHMMESARRLLAEDNGVVLDATFRSEPEREQVEALADSLGATLRIVQCNLAPQIVRTRLAERFRNKDGNSDATWEICEQQRNLGWPEWTADALRVDTSGRLANVAAQVSASLRVSEVAQRTRQLPQVTT